jgi:ATP-dependent DNA helicase DinG
MVSVLAAPIVRRFAAPPTDSRAVASRAAPYSERMHELAALFDPSGTLAERLPGFSYRAEQRQMAERVGDALASGRHLCVEAGTGIGKTFAYLAPVLLTGRRAIVSTGTRTLQDQLFHRDLPSLAAVIGRPVEVALLKGRANYLCRHRLELARQQSHRDSAWQTALEAVADWGRISAAGDLNELEDLADEHPLRAAVSSTVDNCLNARCGFFDACSVLKARRAAQTARVVIVNHHLLLADLALKEAGFGELLPGAEVVIVDEAHQLPDIAQLFFGFSLRSRDLRSLARDAAAEAHAAGVGSMVEGPSALLAACVAQARGGAAGETPARWPWSGAPKRLHDAAAEWQSALRRLSDALSAIADTSAGLERCRERCAAAIARLEAFASEDAETGLRWCEQQPGGLALHATPLDSGSVLGERIEAQGGVWIFASATLAIGGSLEHFRERIGIRDAAAAVLPSPFDYSHNAGLYLPPGLPQPDQPDHLDSLMHTVWPLLIATGGGAFLLFTSHRALSAAHAWLADRPGIGPLLVQGMLPRTELLERFRAAGDAVLLGTGSFWQGVDVRGPALRLVVIDKLPFAAPGDPLLQARLEAIRRDGGDPFVALQLPQAVLALKQGVGRLIRDFDDRGMVVLGDPRVRTRGYGRVFLESLPPMRRLEDAQAAMEFARGLAPAATALCEAAGP